jgi:hypothetical protein
MANIERLTKRVKKIEEWQEENEGGPTMDNMNYLIFTLRNLEQQWHETRKQHDMLTNLHREFLTEKEMGDEWNDWLKEKENAVQKQQTEEVPLQEQAESSEEASEAPVKETKD